MDWIVELFNKLIEFLYRLIISLVDMLKDLFFWAIEQVFSAVNVLLSWVLGFFSPLDIGQYLSAIPPNVSWVLAAIGIPQCLVIIFAAITCRILLQLIPFTRLGS